MKTTFDLPEDLVKDVKYRAVHDGRRLKDTVADLLRKGLGEGRALTTKSRHLRAVLATDSKTGLPLIKSPARAPISKLTPREIQAQANQSLEDEDIERLRLSFRR